MTGSLDSLVNQASFSSELPWPFNQLAASRLIPQLVPATQFAAPIQTIMPQTQKLLSTANNSNPTCSREIGCSMESMNGLSKLHSQPNIQCTSVAQQCSISVADAPLDLTLISPHCNRFSLEESAFNSCQGRPLDLSLATHQSVSTIYQPKLPLNHATSTMSHGIDLVPAWRLSPAFSTSLITNESCLIENSQNDSRNVYLSFPPSTSSLSPTNSFSHLTASQHAVFAKRTSRPRNDEHHLQRPAPKTLINSTAINEIEKRSASCSTVLSLPTELADKPVQFDARTLSESRVSSSQISHLNKTQVTVELEPTTLLSKNTNGQVECDNLSKLCVGLINKPNRYSRQSNTRRRRLNNELKEDVAIDTLKQTGLIESDKETNGVNAVSSSSQSSQFKDTNDNQTNDITPRINCNKIAPDSTATDNCTLVSSGSEFFSNKIILKHESKSENLSSPTKSLELAANTSQLEQTFSTRRRMSKSLANSRNRYTFLSDLPRDHSPRKPFKRFARNLQSINSNSLPSRAFVDDELTRSESSSSESRSTSGSNEKDRKLASRKSANNEQLYCDASDEDNETETSDQSMPIKSLQEATTNCLKSKTDNQEKLVISGPIRLRRLSTEQLSDSPAAEDNVTDPHKSTRSGSTTYSNPRMKRHPNMTPQELKDADYWEKRLRNNEAARRSRQARRSKESQLAVYADELERENEQLRHQIDVLKAEVKHLKANKSDHLGVAKPTPPN